MYLFCTCESFIVIYFLRINIDEDVVANTSSQERKEEDICLKQTTSEPLQSFDRTVWDSVIDECIISGLDADGNDDPYKITFIYKTGDKGSGNGLNYKSTRKNAKDRLCSLDANNVSTKESQDT